MGIRKRVKRIQALLVPLDAKVDRIMSLANDLKASIKQLDDETTAIGARIAELSGRLTNNMSDAQVAEVQADFKALSDRLTLLAADPTNPVPAPPEPTP